MRKRTLRLLRNSTTDTPLNARRLPAQLLDLLQAGGKYPLLERQGIIEPWELAGPESDIRLTLTLTKAQFMNSYPTIVHAEEGMRDGLQIENPDIPLAGKSAAAEPAAAIRAVARHA